MTKEAKLLHDTDKEPYAHGQSSCRQHNARRKREREGKKVQGRATPKVDVKAMGKQSVPQCEAGGDRDGRRGRVGASLDGDHVAVDGRERRRGHIGKGAAGGTHGQERCEKTKKHKRGGREHRHNTYVCHTLQFLVFFFFVFFSESHETKKIRPTCMRDRVEAQQRPHESDDNGGHTVRVGPRDVILDGATKKQKRASGCGTIPFFFFLC